MKNIITSLLLVLIVILFTTSTYAQETEFKPGDKVEASFLGEWMRGQIKEKAGEKYVVILERSGSESKFKPKNIRLRKDDPAGAANTTNAGTTTAQGTSSEAKETIGNEPCADWSAWGIMNRRAFMSAASEKYSTGYTISLHDLVCWVKTRKVDFQLTSQEEATVNDLRHSPELLQALKDNYKPEKPVDYGKASGIKTGRYACGGRTYQPDLFILPNNEYNTRDLKGKYSFSPTTNKIAWATGTFAGGTMTGEYFPNIITITVYNVKGQILFNCNWAEK